MSSDGVEIALFVRQNDDAVPACGLAFGAAPAGVTPGERLTSDERRACALLRADRRRTTLEVAHLLGIPERRAWHAVHRLLNWRIITAALPKICPVRFSEAPTFKLSHR